MKVRADELEPGDRMHECPLWVLAQVERAGSLLFLVWEQGRAQTMNAVEAHELVDVDRAVRCCWQVAEGVSCGGPHQRIMVRPVDGQQVGVCAAHLNSALAGGWR